MAKFRPFSAIRPKAGMEDKIAALPYDVYNREEAKAFVTGHPESFLAIDRAESQFPDDVDTYDPRVYDKARDMILERLEDGRFVQDEKPGFYLYELTMDGRSQTGVVGCASIEDYENQVILKHENTRADKEQDRINHVGITGMQTGPIFLACPDDDALSAVIDTVKARTADCDFTSEDGIRHRVWSVFDEGEITKLSEIFGTFEHLYIADGHHRCASAVKVGERMRDANPADTGEEEYHYFLSVVFRQSELKILDYNRVVKDLNGLTTEEFLAKVGECFTVSAPESAAVRPAKKGEFGMLLDGKWYRLEAKDSVKSDDPVKGLDVSILQDHLLNPILGIQDPKTDKRIDFVGGIRGLGELERRTKEDCKLAFSMYPTSMEELFAVAGAHLLMPPKSTWFEPKLRSGLFLHRISQSNTPF